MSDGFSTLDATAQAALVRRGETQPGELIEAAIARIEKQNPDLNAVIHPLFEKARRAVADGAIADGPFRGVPFLVKDAVCHTAGDPYHVGMRFLKDRGYEATHDTELARRFRAAGFIFVGKTNTPELAMSATTEPLAYGASLNPWDPERSTGGSSGGSAAAVAAGLAPVAHANDMGGSIRVPAAFCGLVGLKPTRARSTLAPSLSEYWGPLTHEHVLTRSLRDSAGVLDCIAGPAPGDPYSAPAPARPFVQEIGADPGTLRVGLLSTAGLTEVHHDCLAAAQQTALRLEALGHRVEEIALPELARVNPGPWMQAGIARELDRWSEITGDSIAADDVEPLNWLMAELGWGMTGAQYVAAAESAFAWARQLYRPWVEEIDILITPTTSVPAPEIGWLAPTVPTNELLPRLGAVTAFTLPFDVTGQPAISLPVHLDGIDLPVGVQLVAATAREDLLFRLASQLETAHPWSHHRPVIHA